jgi:predicted acyl esterase
VPTHPATSNAFLPGHRIRLDVTSSDFPKYDRNHNTAADQNAETRPWRRPGRRSSTAATGRRA